MNFSKLIWCEPWLAPIVLNLQNIIVTESLETIGITPDGTTIYYNPLFWKKLKPKERLGVQLHEILHIANCHAARQEYRTLSIWNIACDHAINYQIAASGYSLPSNALEGINDSAENIYNQLSDKLDLKSDNLSSKKDSLFIGSGQHPSHEIQNNSKSILDKDLLEKNIDGSKVWQNLDTMEAIESAKKLASHGMSPLSKHFQPLLSKTDWKRTLQSLVKSSLGDDLDYLLYEFDEFGICEDILYPKPLPKICALIDESASISNVLFQQFLGELSKMARFAAIWVSGFTDNTELNPIPLKKYHRSMTGGTDITVPYIQACQKDFECIIVLTDGYLTFPLIEQKPTIWVMPQSFERNMEVII